MTSNSGLCSEAKGSEKKPKLARIAVGKVIVESPVVSCPFVSCLFDLELGLRSEKKPKLARITVGRVIVYKFSGDLSPFSVVCLIWSFFMAPFLKFMTSYSGLSYVVKPKGRKNCS